MTKNFKSNSDDKKNLSLKKQQRIYAKHEIIGRSVHMIGEPYNRWKRSETLCICDRRIICEDDRGTIGESSL